MRKLIIIASLFISTVCFSMITSKAPPNTSSSGNTAEWYCNTSTESHVWCIESNITLTVCSTVNDPWVFVYFGFRALMQAAQDYCGSMLPPQV